MTNKIFIQDKILNGLDLRLLTKISQIRFAFYSTNSLCHGGGGSSWEREPKVSLERKAKGKGKGKRKSEETKKPTLADGLKQISIQELKESQEIPSDKPITAQEPNRVESVIIISFGRGQRGLKTR